VRWKRAGSDIGFPSNAVNAARNASQFDWKSRGEIWSLQVFVYADQATIGSKSKPFSPRISRSSTDFTDWFGFACVDAGALARGLMFCFLLLIF
jgi:hypothetical protein